MRAGGDFETRLREMAGGRKKDAVENQAKEKMLGDFIEKFQFPVPETFVQAQIDARLDRGLRALAQQGMTSDDMRKLDFQRFARGTAGPGRERGEGFIDSGPDCRG